MRASACPAPLFALLACLSGMAAGADQPRPAASSWPRVESELPADPQLEARVAGLLARLTLEQKIGQMIQAEIAYVTPGDVRKYRLGSILNGGGSFPGGNKRAAVADWVSLADAFHAASVAGVDEGVAVPIMWGTDAVHGHNNVVGATIFPHNVGLGATGDPELVERIGAATAREVAATGIDWVFAPTLAVARDDRWGRTYESYSEEPALVREYGRHMVIGLQGRAGSADFLGPGRVIATAKHFIGDGGTIQGQDQGNTVADPAALRDIHAQGYFSTLAAGVQTVMASFSSVNGVKMHGNEALLTGVLKRQMGFDGLVVSDWNGIGQVPGCSNSSCPQAVNAGIDLIMAPEDWKALYHNLLQQVGSGVIPMSRIDDAVARILRVKLRAGLFEKGPPSSRPFAGDTSVLGSPAHRALAREAVRKSLVLLKNRGGLLPLKPGLRVLVTGDGADNLAKQAGGWSVTWQGTGNTNADFPGATTIFAGIRQAAEAAGGSAFLAPSPDTETARADVAIVVFGEDPYAEGQGDRESLDYSAGNPGDLATLRRLQKSGLPTVAVFLTGRPMWVNPELNAADAFVVAWLPGSEGAGVADLLFRDATGAIVHDFTGRLAFSWPASSDPRPANVAEPGGDVLFAPGYGLGHGVEDTVPPDLPEVRSAPRPGAADIRIFERRAMAPWQLFVGDSANWHLPLPGGAGASSGGVVTVTPVDKDVQGDSIRVQWSGRGEGQVYFQAAGPRDFTGALDAASALWITLRVDAPPKAPVFLRMDCGHPCGAKGDITRLLRAAPPGEWVRLSVDLKCFARSGADMMRIDTPLLMTTTGRMALSLSSASIVPGAASQAAISCQRGE